MKTLQRNGKLYEVLYITRIARKVQRQEAESLGEWLLVLVITVVVFSFMLYFVVRNAIDNSARMKRLEGILEEISEDLKRRE